MARVYLDLEVTTAPSDSRSKSRSLASVPNGTDNGQSPGTFLTNAISCVQAARTQARREREAMAVVAAGTTSLVTFTLPSTPLSARAARAYIRTALGFHDLDRHASEVEAVTSELVSNAVTHAGARSVDVGLLLLEDGLGTVAVVVTDPSERPPVRHDATPDAEHGRGLLMVEALATRWGWVPQNPGKAVFAVFTRRG